MKVSVAYATPNTQLWRSFDVQTDATVEDVINISGILDAYAINLKQQKIGIYGKFTKLNALVNEGDRVEIYHPITRILDEDDDDDDD